MKKLGICLDQDLKDICDHVVSTYAGKWYCSECGSVFEHPYHERAEGPLEGALLCPNCGTDCIGWIPDESQRGEDDEV